MTDALKFADVKPSKNADIIGIDLGTCNTCVGVWKNGMVDIVANAEGSIVTFVNTGKPEGSKIIDDKNGIPIVQIGSGKKAELKYPSEITSHLLKYMKQTAEKALNTTVTKAVITIPAYFKQSHRDATKEAAKMAGLEVEELLTEPAAAAYAFGMDQEANRDYKLLVFDMGAGTFDVTIVQYQASKSKFVVKGIDGDLDLGGRDFDNVLCNYFEEEIRRVDSQFVFNKLIRQKLLVKCEKVKRALSSATVDRIPLSDFFPGTTAVLSITREGFEKICKHLVEKSIEITDRLITERLGGHKNQINKILIVGGSTRIPLVQQCLRDFFNGKELNQTVNPDEAVAYGATIRASQLCEHTKEQAPKIYLIEATPLTLGVDSLGRIFQPMIMRNSQIPKSKTMTFLTTDNDQKSMTFKIFEGERKIADANRILTEFTIDGLPAGIIESVEVQLTMTLDKNGMLSLSATCNERTVIKKIKYGEKMVPVGVANKMVEKSQQFNEQDGEQVKQLFSRYEFETAILNLRYRLDKLDVFNEAAKVVLDPICRTNELWLVENLDRDPSVYNRKLLEFLASISLRSSDRDTQHWKYIFGPDPDKKQRKRKRD
uniref:Heat shock protein 70 n=1 Tax=Ditylenchus dipsaci TaxID=166011 RepID=A0A915EB21_9BILA